MLFLHYCIYSVSCPVRGRFLEAVLSADRARAGRTGAPRTGRQAGGLGGAPGGAAPYVTGRARFTLPREVGTLLPPQGCPLVPWRLPPLHLAWACEGLANLGRIAPRDCRSLAV